MRSVPSRQGMPLKSTGCRRSARTSTYWRPAAVATCWAIIDLAAPGGPYTMLGLAGLDQKGEHGSKLARAQRVARGNLSGKVIGVLRMARNRSGAGALGTARPRARRRLAYRLFVSFEEARRIAQGLCGKAVTRRAAAVEKSRATRSVG